MILLNLFIVCILFLLGTALAGLEKLVVFWDTPSFLFVLLGLLIHVFRFGRQQFLRGMSLIVFFSQPPDAETARYFHRLTRFSFRLGLAGMLLGLVLALINIDPETIGFPMALSLLTFLYASGPGLFLFWPIAKRFEPNVEKPVRIRFPFEWTLVALASFFAVRCIFVLILIAMQAFKEYQGPIRMEQLAEMLFAATFRLNPPDAGYGEINYLNPLIWWDVSSLLLVFGSLGALRIAAGRFRNGFELAPIFISIGLFWTVQSFVFMLCDLDPKLYVCGSMVSMLPTFYGLAAAIVCIYLDLIRVPRSGSSEPLSPDAEQARRILDDVVKKE